MLTPNTSTAVEGHFLCCVQAGILFDNGGTVFLSVFISLWAVTFHEHWKRCCVAQAHRWDCSDFQEIEVLVQHTTGLDFDLDHAPNPDLDPDPNTDPYPDLYPNPAPDPDSDPNHDLLTPASAQERPRPEFTAMAPMTLRNPVTGLEEPYFPGKKRFNRTVTGCMAIIIMVGVAGIDVLG